MMLTCVNTTVAIAMENAEKGPKKAGSNSAVPM